ncbi:MAG: hypothetical protein LBB82_09200 [Treponema sp.]|nr:hypothetical protein [Treponema sp.]
MKRRFAVFILAVLGAFVFAQASDPAQDEEAETPDNGAVIIADIDALFSGDHEPEDVEELKGRPYIPLLSGLKLRGLAMDASFRFLGGWMPGWSEAPWYRDEYETEFTNLVGAEMQAMLGLDFQFSDSLRVKSSFSYRLPNFSFVLDEFFFDYNLVSRAFFRVGKYNHSWGISPNFPFTNLLARVPYGSPGGELYLARVDVPFGIGGFQFLGLTRTGFLRNADRLTVREIAGGGKYNLAFRYADIDLGGLYFYEMPLRFFTSVKATIVNTEVYAEGMYAMDLETPDGVESEKEKTFSWNAGLIQGFFNDKLTVNGEVFYNGEKNSFYYQEESEIKRAQTSPFIQGFNLALNFMYRFNWNHFRLFAQGLYSLKEKSAQVVPGLSFVPYKDVTVTLAVPMALGKRDGTYYRSNTDRENRPFSVMLGVRITGSYSLAKYEDD